MLDRATHALLGEIADMDHLTARGIHRMLRVARTVADLAGHVPVTKQDVLGAHTLRDPGALLQDRAAA
jgi:predicted ATPase with chaperone activity